ncbi:cytochrome-c peroxidase [uncultured Vibrio sp.]|uniref:cytochrome-c peroxidase n=1 Tax=uncultured Vibrio sp. TaxID=114054 RepID=UPI0026032800|nr:cytochrome c peroxidase [uncultured Vibrio sp.]
MGLNGDEKIGLMLFMDKNLSDDKTISCSSCHEPKYDFRDINNVTKLRDRDASIIAPSLRGVHKQEWFFWDGRSDAIWNQAIEALENPSEHSIERNDIFNYICGYYTDKSNEIDSLCKKKDESVTEELVITVGKYIESYVSSINHYWTRFDQYNLEMKTNGVSDVLTPSEVNGLKLFIDRKKTGCIDCHNGIRFTNNNFFSTGTVEKGSRFNRYYGIDKYLSSEFNCRTIQEDCAQRKYLKEPGDDDKGALKVPSLRNLRHHTQFMHDGRFKTLEEVLFFYTNPMTLPITHIDIKPLRVFPHQQKDLINFLMALNDEYNTNN